MLPKRQRAVTVFVLFYLELFRCVYSEKAYPLGCSQKPPSYYDYYENEFPPPSLPVRSLDDYVLTSRLGTGKFSDVFEAVDVQAEKRMFRSKHPDEVDPRTLVVVKCLKPVSERKIRREILVLQRACQLPNLPRLLAIVVSPEYYADHRRKRTDLPRMPALVLQHAGPNAQWLCHGVASHPSLSNHGPAAIVNPSSPSSTSAADSQATASGTSSASSSLSTSPWSFTSIDDSSFLTDYEIRYYLYHLLTALDGLHAIGIMHRDVKPRNVLINRRGRALHAPLMLIDLGLADFYHPHVAYNVRVASRHYKAPELLLGYPSYHYAIDMWGVGCILVGLLFRREPFFRGRDNIDQLGKIVEVLGTDDLWAFVQKVQYQVQLSDEVQRELSKYSEIPSLSTLSSSSSSSSSSTSTAATSQYRHRQNWLSVMAQDGATFPSPNRDALDLLDHLLVYDHDERWTARQAMQHRYFDIVRERVQAELQARQAADGPRTPIPVSTTATPNTI